MTRPSLIIKRMIQTKPLDLYKRRWLNIHNKNYVGKNIRNEFNSKHSLLTSKSGSSVTTPYSACALKMSKINVQLGESLNFNQITRRFKKFPSYYNRAIFMVVCAWAIFEIVLCMAYYFNEEKSDHVDNFLSGLCVEPEGKEKKCGGFINKAFIVRATTATLLLLGSLLVLLNHLPHKFRRSIPNFFSSFYENSNGNDALHSSIR